MKKDISSVRFEDLEYICSCDFIKWRKLENAIVLITGASGLIGSAITNSLLYASKKYNLNLKVIASVRNVKKAKRKVIIDGDIIYLEKPIESLTEVPYEITHIIHAANPTSSKFFVQNPVETIKTAVNGTNNILDIAKEKRCKSVVFLSSMEVYGYPHKGSLVAEEDIGNFDPTTIRNCYPLSKILCESMVSAYSSEYAVPGIIVRLTQTFGPGVEYNDSRIFAEFARCVIEECDITLHSDGKTERCYLYVADAVTAIITALLEGEAGQAYTAANSATYCSIYDMAKMVAHDVAKDKIAVKFEIDDVDRGYANTLYMNLNTEKLISLGWKADRSLKEMFVRMIGDMKCQ